MDAFTNRVRTFDAFPKVDSQHTVRSQRGGLSTIMMIFCGLLILWVEVGGYLGGYVDHQFIVDDQIRSDLSINIDMLVAMPCEFLHTNAMDITHDRYLAAETLNFEGRDFFVPMGFKVNNANNEYETPNLERVMQDSVRAEFSVSGVHLNEGAPACHIFGSIPVNKVRGDFHITAKGFGYSDRLHVSRESLNFTHMIQEFSYGDFYPYLDNPLDATGKITEENTQVYRYFTKVVPTIYEKLGLVIDTNQYSLTEQHNVAHPDRHSRYHGVPGIYFKYNFEPIKLVIVERRLSFWQFVSRLATIIGGLLVFAGYVYRLYERLLTVLYGKKYTEKDTEKTHGILGDADKSR